MKFSEIEIGQTAMSQRMVTADLVAAFAEVSGDFNPLHLDEEFAASSIFKRRIAHGILGASFISALIANELPGEGSIYLGQNLKFLKPVFIGDIVTTQLTVTDLLPEKRIVLLSTLSLNQHGGTVISGEATIKLTL